MSNNSIEWDKMCNHLEKMINAIECGEHSVRYENGIKPSNYFSPDIRFSTKDALERKTIPAWFAEIFVDDVCIFRECHISSDNDWATAEQRANQRLIGSIFCYGIAASRKQLQEMKIN